MSTDVALNIAKRFVTLPLAKRRVYLEKMHAENISPANLPIPAVKALYERIPLSYAQQRQWFLWQLEPQGCAYNMPTALRLKGSLNVDALRDSFRALIERHQTLRTTFGQAEEQWVQIIHPVGEFALRVESAQWREEDSIGPQLKQWVEAEVHQPFDLENEWPLRVKLLSLGPDDHVLLLTLHHIVTDGWSMQVMVDELIQFYAHFHAGASLNLPDLHVQYADYAIWQRHWMEAGEQERQLAYWQSVLGSEHPVLELPTDRPRPVMQSFTGASLGFDLPQDLGAALKHCAHQQGVTLFTLLLASFQTLLHRYSGQDEIRVGVPIANRNRVETERLIGFFVNTQVLKAEFDPHTTFSGLLTQVANTVLAAQAYQELPFEQLVEALHPERSLSHSPLFQVMYNHQTQAQATRRSLPGLSVEGITWERQTAQFDLTLNTLERTDGLGIEFNYATAMFDKASIERMAEHWCQLLRAIAEQPQQRIEELSMLNESEQRLMIEQWNRTAAPYPNAHSVHGLIQAQVGRAPDATALLFGEHRLSYLQLNQRANRLAHALRTRGVGPDVLVGIAMERSMEMVVGLLAILKAGGAYVPFDPEYPRDRLAYMMQDSGIGLLLTQAGLVDQLPIPDLVESLVVEADGRGLEPYSDADPEELNVGAHLAYVIYTSGSTGKPKGAGNSHQALVNRLWWMQNAYGLDASDTVLQKTPFSFDVSVWEFFWPLLTGARLVLAQPGDHRDPERLVEIICARNVTTLHFVPSMLQAFMGTEHVERCSSITRLICSGEALPADLSEQVLKRLPASGLYNLYGPTEAAIDVTHWTCQPHVKGSVPIGVPIDNLKAHILSRCLLPVPQGVSAELYLGGTGLARGYHRRPALTAERFVPDPYDQSEQGGGRLYRTGDLARYRTGGVIDYAGRLDHQVKIRGLRIELGEIETKLLEYPGIRETVVIDIDGVNGKQLAAYLVADKPDAIVQDELRAHLKVSLPDFMVPTYLIEVEALALTPNGKLDRKALPKPDVTQRQHVYVAPQGELQERLAAIWATVLKLQQVGITDNFFELGGDSIISIQVVSRARREGIRFTPKQLFQHQTVQGLAAVAEYGANASPASDHGVCSGPVKLLPAQLACLERSDNRELYQLLTPRQPLHAGHLQQALEVVVQHHDALRSTFREPGSAWIRTQAEQQSAWDEAPLLWRAELEGEPELAALHQELVQSLDCHQGHVTRAALASLADGTQRLLWVAHPLVIDAASWPILLQDLERVYTLLCAGHPVRLATKTHSVAALAEGLQRGATDEGLQAILASLSAEWAGVTTDLPELDEGDSSLQTPEGRVLVQLGREHTDALLNKAPLAYRAQVEDLLLSALTPVLARWTGGERVAVLLQGDHRNARLEGVDLHRTVGALTCQYPAALSGHSDLGASIKGIKEQVSAARERGVGLAALRYLGSEPARRALEALPVPSISFSYQPPLDCALFEAVNAVTLSTAAVSVHAQVQAGQLRFDWVFNHSNLAKARVQQLADDTLRALQQVVAHCMAPEAGGVTPSDFPLCALSQAQLDSLPVPAAQIEDIYPLSPTQKGMLFHSIEDAGDGLYINQVSLPIKGLKVAEFTQAWAAVIARHAMLRTSFHWAGLDEPVQVVHTQAQMPLRQVDLQAQGNAQGAVQDLARQEVLAGFDMAKAPLHRMLLVQLDPATYQMVWTSHHLLMDGWSKSRLFAEIMQHYSGHPVTADTGSYRDFIAWLQAQDKTRQESFWRASLANSEVTSLSQAIHPRHVSVQGGHHALYTRRDNTWTARLQQYCRQLRITPNTLVQGAWLLLLQRYTGKRTVTFGATVAGRPEGLAHSDTMLGLFINTLPVSQTLDPQARLQDWLRDLQAYNLELRNWSHTPLNEVQRWSAAPGQKLFDSIIVFENYPIDEGLREAPEAGVQFGDSNEVGVTNFPMDLAVHLNDTLMIEYLYLRDSFSEAAVDGIRETMEAALEAMLREPDALLGNLDYLPAAQRQATLHWGAQPHTSYRDELLPDLIGEQAVLRPTATAVVCGTERISYAQLDLRSTKLAHALRSRGAAPEIIVGVALQRSVELVVTLLAVMKAGAAYVPLDLDYPRERLAWMMEDSGMSLLVTRPGFAENLPAHDHLGVLTPDAEPSQAEPRLAGKRLDERNLAYLIYTSGSTGKPKGVAVTHGPLSRHCQAITHLYEMGPQTRELHFMSFAFDGAQERCLSVLASGGTLVVRERDLWTAEQTLEALWQHEITIACFPPAYLKQLAETVHSRGLKPPPVHIYCFGGDAVPEQSFEQVKAALKPRFFTNGYGPTETVVTPLLWKVPAHSHCQAAYAPIGRAVGLRSLAVVDDELNPLALEFSGELMIGGDGIARGYHGRPALTAERFVPDPQGQGTRMYRSGDLVRRRPDGVVEYVGRMDHQVKIRGFRIELGEVEACLRAQSGVRDAVVVVREGPLGKQLIGYVVGAQQSLAELKRALADVLPDYMVPSHLVEMAALPLTPNGKLDRIRLPEPELADSQYVAPRNEREGILLQIWQNVLQAEQLGVTDNFFEHGGDSILSLQVVSQARNHPQLQMDLKLRDLLRYQTVEAIVANADAQLPGSVPARTQAVEGTFNLAPIQAWMFAQSLPEPAHFNQALLLTPQEPLDLKAVEYALRCVEQHHDALRLQFHQREGGWVQSYAETRGEEQDRLTSRAVGDATQITVLANEVHRSFDLAEAPLWRAVHIQLPDGQERLLLVLHHLLMDGVSWRILLEDLQAAYQACRQSREALLPARTSSYQTWAQRLQTEAGRIEQQQAQWWMEQVSHEGAPLPCANPRGRNEISQQIVAQRHLSPDQTALLLKHAPMANRSQVSEVLLTALARTLCRLSAQTAVTIQLEGHGREDLFEGVDVSRTLGWFNSLFPVRLVPGLEGEAGAALLAVQRQLAAVPDNGLGYGVLRYMGSPEVRKCLHESPQPKVTFNYLGLFDAGAQDHALFSSTAEDSGDSVHPQARLVNDLQIVAQVHDGVLSVRCIYSKRRYRAETVDAMMTLLVSELHVLIDHCVAVSRLR
ncbi:non-ribosomal peptide synthetase [Pseudomonas eucalypticola]|uniref:Amino acid adenylation domain-containing protein n=1 Tax=Pseudomonas eucalypticola TaxID=2599595 RepID=A0A7D5D7Z3_9PSED|nr:non-ribosomal peptide synthetase [Pseudomonas eucalypticola]QKZ04395.1 amino acid adenylation domain-containing protein [Pseudomonas eucalypticola]